MKIFIGFIVLLYSTAVIGDFPQFFYRARVTGVYDGDTITADIDLGFHTVRTDEKIRLYGIDAPEIRGPDREAAIKSRDALRGWILGDNIIIQTIHDKKGSFGRYLGIVFLDGQNINERLVKEGFAVYKEYR